MTLKDYKSALQIVRIIDLPYNYQPNEKCLFAALHLHSQIKNQKTCHFYQKNAMKHNAGETYHMKNIPNLLDRASLFHRKMVQKAI